jgi:predicted amidohydrolase
MKQMADQTGALILGSFIANVQDRVYNRLLWMEPDGNFKTYDKRHLFRMAEENHTYTPGESLLIGHWKGWRICPLICYDLRFPVWTRNEMINGQPKFDLMIYVANWPSVRAEVWKTLLKARAIENVSYVIGVNRIGEDGNGHAYSGDSAIVNYRGELTQELSLEELNAFREKFPALNDADSFQLK